MQMTAIRASCLLLVLHACTERVVHVLRRLRRSHSDLDAPGPQPPSTKFDLPRAPPSPSTTAVKLVLEVDARDRSSEVVHGECCGGGSELVDPSPGPTRRTSRGRNDRRQPSSSAPPRSNLELQRKSHPQLNSISAPTHAPTPPSTPTPSSHTHPQLPPPPRTATRTADTSTSERMQADQDAPPPRSVHASVHAERGFLRTS